MLGGRLWHEEHRDGPVPGEAPEHRGEAARTAERDRGRQDGAESLAATRENERGAQHPPHAHSGQAARRVQRAAAGAPQRAHELAGGEELTDAGGGAAQEAGGGAGE